MAKYPYKNFSFKDLPIKWLLGYVATSVVGLKRVIGMYYNHSSNKIEVEYAEILGFVADEREIEIYPFYPTGLEKHIDLLREKNQQIEWITPQDIGIDIDNIKSHSIGKADLFAEEERCVLAIRFRNSIDSKHDILFLHFQVANSYLLPKGQLINLTTEIKAMIAPTLHRLLLNRLYEMRRDAEQFDLVSLSEEIRSQPNKPLQILF
jgi:hypothetical protein